MKGVFIYVPLHTGEAAKCVTTGRYQETGKEQEACTPSALVTSNGTGFGPTTFSPQKQYVLETQKEPMCLTLRLVTGCLCTFSAPRHCRFQGESDQTEEPAR